MKSGAYLLLIAVANDIKVEVGALGDLEFPKGYYVYAGSGMNNVSKRVERHLSKDKKLHWHIDYLLNHPKVKVVDTRVFRTDKRIECKINQAILKDKGAEVLHKKFGSSDCKSCDSHLIHIKYRKCFYKFSLSQFLSS